MTQTRLYNHRLWPEADNFRLTKKRDCTICIAKTKVLISCTVTAQLISIFVFAYAKGRFAHDAVPIRGSLIKSVARLKRDK